MQVEFHEIDMVKKFYIAIFFWKLLSINTKAMVNVKNSLIFDIQTTKK